MIVNDNLKTIFSYLDPHSLNHARITCKKWNTLIEAMAKQFFQQKSFSPPNPLAAYHLYKTWTLPPISSDFVVKYQPPIFNHFSLSGILFENSDQIEKLNKFLEKNLTNYSGHPFCENKLASFQESTIRILDLKKIDVTKEILLKDLTINSVFYFDNNEIAAKVNENMIILINLDTLEQVKYDLVDTTLSGFSLSQTKNFLILELGQFGVESKEFHLINKKTRKQTEFYKEDNDVLSKIVACDDHYLAILNQQKKLIIYKDGEDHLIETFFIESAGSSAIKFYNGFLFYKNNETSNVLVINPSNGHTLFELKSLGNHLISINFNELITKSSPKSNQFGFSKMTYHKTRFNR